MQKTRKSKDNPMEVMSCHAGTPAGSRTIIEIGEVSGIMDIHTANCPFGLDAMDGMNIMERISGMVTGMVYCCESLSLSTTDPVAAYRVA